MAPGAQAIAMFVGKPPVAPDLSDIASAILMLSFEHDVDLINISAGVYDPGAMEKTGVRDAVEAAWENGTVCIAAAGNQGQSAVAFPARFVGLNAVSRLRFRLASIARSRSSGRGAAPSCPPALGPKANKLTGTLAADLGTRRTRTEGTIDSPFNRCTIRPR